MKSINRENHRYNVYTLSSTPGHCHSRDYSFDEVVKLEGARAGIILSLEVAESAVFRTENGRRFTVVCTTDGSPF